MRATILVSLIFLALLGLLAPKTPIHPATILVGEQYTVLAGETRQGDMLVLFARVTVAEGGQVDGDIIVVGGVFEIAGQVSGDAHAYASDVSLDTPSARVDGAVNTVYSLRGLPLVPSILLVIS
jgi:hypothetical protein